MLEALELVKIGNLRDRSPSELSGGQQQRVALARAIVIEPGVLLMDEPLSKLDAKLRVEMRTIIKKLQKNLGITTIYVTHDQEEALAISDRIAVMRLGEIMQIDTPEKIYKSPQNTFVAGFIGTSNFITGKIEKMQEGEQTEIVLGNQIKFRINLKKPYIGSVKLSIRPEAFRIVENDEWGINGKIILDTFLGDFVNYEVELEDGSVVEVNEYTKDIGRVRPIEEKVKLSFEPDKISIYDSQGEEVLS